MVKKLNTYEKAMQDPAFKKEFNKRYKKFLLSELSISLMQNDQQSVHSIAKQSGISTGVINKLRTGKQEE